MSLRRGNGSETKVHSVAPLAVRLHFSVCISFDMPRMSCILNIYLRSFIQYAVFKVQSGTLSVPNGDGEIRTLDPLLARQVLSQLSYTPTDAGLPLF